MAAALRAYRSTWSERDYDSSRLRSPDELRDITGHELVNAVKEAPAAPCEPGQPPMDRFGDGVKKYLWVVRSQDMPYALEEGELGSTIEGRGKLSHTNLTGGSKAHCGGEIWFEANAKLWLTGGSGRYPPRSKEELASIVESLQTAGYEVISAGWSDELGGPARYFRTGGG